jgi:hypothetical protein
MNVLTMGEALNAWALRPPITSGDHIAVLMSELRQYNPASRYGLTNIINQLSGRRRSELEGPQLLELVTQGHNANASKLTRTTLKGVYGTAKLWVVPLPGSRAKLGQ